MSRGILAVNAGSSTLKLTLFSGDTAMSRRASATVERVSTDDAAGGFDAALESGLRQIEREMPLDLGAAGHRIVHGGDRHADPETVTPALVADLRRLEPIDPTHMPQSLSLIEAVSRRFAGLTQIACFDTAFHQTMPRRARLYALPRWTWTAGIRRYGFHGLSCESILHTLHGIDAAAARGRLVIAHLGNGASVTAVHDGKSVDTTMGFSPTGGLMMGTRSGDLDPGVMTFLARSIDTGMDGLDRLLTRESGLLGVSGLTSDMQQLLASRKPEAHEAVDLFCYAARKHVAALVAALNGADTLVFTGGIGEHAGPVRERICAGLQHLGIEIASPANAANDPIISTPASRVTVRVMHTDEDLAIARHVRRLLA